MTSGEDRKEQVAALVLSAARGVGLGKARELRRRYGSYHAAVAAALRAGPGAGSLARSVEEAARAGSAEFELELAGSHGARYAVPGSADYPQPLYEIARAPVGLFVAGAPLAGLQPALAIVGARAPTRRGACVARDLAADAAAAGLTVVSGLARGIDTAAHEGALEAGGTTVAVLGSGLLSVYPSENERLAGRIRERGAVVSEYPMRQRPRAGAFPARNRIIAGLSAGVVVVEAGGRSGALITAARALEEGREVFAVPGPVTEPLSCGPNGLIKAGAKLVEGLGDILEELEPSWGPLWDGARRRPNARVSDEPDPGQSGGAGPRVAAREPAGATARLAALLTDQPMSVDELSALAGLPPDVVSAALFELELAGQASACRGGRYARPRRRTIRETSASGWRRACAVNFGGAE